MKFCIIIIIVIVIYYSMCGTYSYMPDTNHVFRVYNVAAVLQLQFMPHGLLLHTLNILYFP
jgi:hypothetical protein